MPIPRHSVRTALIVPLLALLCSIAVLSEVHANPLQAQQVTKPAAQCCGGGGDSFYGADYNRMLTATNDWPQKGGNWCGIADVSAIERYDWLKYNGTDPGASGGNQTTVYNTMNSSAAVSPWGKAYSGYDGPYVAADIAADSGEDPRAQAWAVWDLTPNGYYFHNYIYSPYQGDTTNNTATYLVGLDFGPHNGLNDPIITIIDGGRHALVEDGVFATSDPSAGGETIDSIDLWDSATSGVGTGYLNGYKNASVSTYDWENGRYGNSGFYYWTYPYDTGTWSQTSVLDPPPSNVPIDPNAKNSNTENRFDPDPYTQSGTYYDTTQTNGKASLFAHWENSFVTIEQDTVTTCNASPNYALDRYGNLAPHNGSTACG